MNKLLISVVVCLISGCATNVVSTKPIDELFHDELFGAASGPVHAEDALAVSDAMRAYIHTEILPNLDGVNQKDIRSTFVKKMYQKGELRLDYDSSQTHTAAQAFESKSGNCMSLVMLTAAMAKEIGLSVEYQSVAVKPDWSKKNNLFVSIGHVNLAISDPFSNVKLWPKQVTIDFIPSEIARTLQTTAIEEKTALAMFSNNRAVEALIDRKINDAYWWARESIKQDSQLPNAYITLGVIYRTVSRSDLSEQVLSRLAEISPDDPMMLRNRILVLRDLGRVQEADQLAERLASLEPDPPMSYYNLAQKEMDAGHFEKAKELYLKEIRRDPDHQEFEFALAVAYFKLHDNKHAYQHLSRAYELSANLPVQALYKAKLDTLKSLGIQ